jgi:lipoprotein-anchoring transpeptidase ErfK/SrfK
MGHRAFLHNRKALLCAMLARTALLAVATPSQAVPFNLQPASQPAAAPLPAYARPAVVRPARPAGVVTASREKAKAATKEKDASQELAARAKGILTVVIAIDKQQLTLYSDGQPVAHSRVSTGQPGHSTPTGVFSIIQRDRWHRSNIYSAAPMWFMQRITWSGVAMHQGVVPNYPASHGCIRMPEAFARQMWGTTKIGARVIVTYGDVTPVAIAHDKLFTLKREPAEPAEPKIDAKIDAKLDAKLEARSEATDSPSAVVKSAHNALEVTQFAASTKGPTTSDAPKVGGPALDAITYALGSTRETPTTFESAKPRTKSVALGEDKPLKPGPVSVFISRKEGKLFVRKGFDPVFDVPVTFEGDQPLGTHVYTAIALNDDGTSFRWHAMSMPGGATAVKKGKKIEVVTGPAATATQALDRVNIPPEAAERISELMSPGSSLIISDKGISGETGKGTDFIVLTR